jgi:hypothetical protein
MNLGIKFPTHELLGNIAIWKVKIGRGRDVIFSMLFLIQRKGMGMLRDIWKGQP